MEVLFLSFPSLVIIISTTVQRFSRGQTLTFPYLFVGRQAIFRAAQEEVHLDGRKYCLTIRAHRPRPITSAPPSAGPSVRPF